MSDPDAQQPVVAAPTTAQNLGSARSALSQLVERLTRLVQDNQEQIQRFSEGATAFKVWVIDDISAEDGSELRAVLLDEEILRTLIRHGWYPTADMLTAVGSRCWLRSWRTLKKSEPHRHAKCSSTRNHGSPPRELLDQRLL